MKTYKEKINIKIIIYRRSNIMFSLLVFIIICLVHSPAYAYNSFLFPGGKIVTVEKQSQHSVYYQGGAMLPTIKQSQMIYYIQGKIKEGSVIAYNEHGHVFVGRVVGVPGDTIKIVGNYIYINNKVVPQKYIGKFTYHPTGKGSAGLYIPTKEYSQTLGKYYFKIIEFNTPEASMKFDPTFVKDNTYYVLGDNRDNSNDSRFNGLVSINKIIGIVHPVVLSSNDLWSLYHANEVVFIKNLTGKYIYIYGTIGSIKTYHHNHAEVVFNGDKMTIGDGVDCIIKNDKDVYGLEASQKILVGGRISKMHGIHLNSIGIFNCKLKTSWLPK